MSNKLKTLSAKQLEYLISKAVGKYLNEDCECDVSNLDTPNIDTEDHVGIQDTRTLQFDVKLTYRDED